MHSSFKLVRIANMALLRCCLLVVVWTVVSAQTNERLVTIEQGPVRGRLSSLDNEVFVFYGIPYATAPTGRDKFKAPLPPPVWTEVLEATDDQIICSQPQFLSREDCLVVNVYLPATQLGPMPVIAYIHGGGFVVGSGTMASPEELVKHGIVVVTMNYRLGATGFLCLKNENIPGNAGFKDQAAALRWIQRNINSFGGNPNDVTIAGYSAGSASVEYMMLSPMARGLFHKVISESASALSPFAKSRDPIAFAKRFVADMVGQNVEDLAEIEEYLLNASPEVLITNMYHAETDGGVGLGLCVEQEIDGVESFLTESPLKILKSGNYNKVPYLTGTTTEDGTVSLPQFDDWKIKMEDNFADFLPVGLNFANENAKNEVAQRAKRFYFNNEPVSDETIRGYLDFSTDTVFTYPLLRSARIHVQNEVPIFLYLFRYIVSDYPSHIHDDKIRGSIHGAQSFCVNRIPRIHNPTSESENDILMRNRLTKMWSDFAKNGVPVPETSNLVPVNWEPMQYDRMNYLSMDVELEAQELLFGDRFTLWDEIYQQYYGSTDETGQSIVVDIEQGQVRGYKSSLGEFYVFYGMPYATAPTGRNKFKAALPPPTFTDIFEATNNNIMCHQPGFAGLSQEDCLAVNVHTPINRQGLLPVMVYFHGGGFTQGYGAMVLPQDLAAHGLVIVTLNYRLGATGFLCMKDEDIPGNAGYKDQVAALRWVQLNIASFGGNPDDVTIAGFSAGAISVEFMMLSPIANGLFHKVISESGSVLIPFSEGRDPIAFAKRFASDIAGNDVEDLEEVKNYLLDATSEELFTDLYYSYQFRKDASAGFTFCVEDEIADVESFLTESPFDVLKKGNYNNVPIMKGITSEEGLLLLPQFDDWQPEMNEHFDDFLPVGLNFANENEKNAVANRVKQFYFNDEPVSYDTIRGFVDYVTDINFGYALLRSARLHVQNSVPVYLYLYKYIVSEYPSHIHDDKIRGAVHCAQSFCVNRIPWLHNPVNESEEDILMRKRLTKMWSDFAKTGVPVPETSEQVPVSWEPMEYDKMNYLSMDVELAARESLLGDRFTLWDEIYEQYYGGGAPALVASAPILLPVLLVIFNLFSKYFSY